ncbi:MAG: hypothetical protein U0790_02160 [Isosphaeraceae bacterium]
MTQRTMRRISLVLLGALGPLVAHARPGVASDPPPRYPFGIETRGLMTWLSLPSIREELKITPEQLAAIKGQAVAVATDVSVAVGQARANEMHSRRKHYDTPPYPFAPDTVATERSWQGRADAAVKKILTASQFKRLGQIDNQRSTSLFEIPLLVRTLGKMELSPTTSANYQQLQQSYNKALSCVDLEREFALRKHVPYREVEKLASEKKRQLAAAYYTRLLAVLTREQRRWWHDYIGPFYRATGDEAEFERAYRDLYDALVLSEDGTVELPLDPYLTLPGGETTGRDYKDYYGFPRSRAGNR